MKSLIAMVLGLVAFLWPSRPVAAYEIDAVASMSFNLSPAGGHATVRSHHQASLISFSFTEGHLILAMQARMFKDGRRIKNATVHDSDDFAAGAGIIFRTHTVQGACLLIEGVYSGRTNAGHGGIAANYPFPAVSGQVFLNCLPIGPCSVITQTSSSLLSLSGDDEGHAGGLAGGAAAVRVPPVIDHPLSRVERRGDNTYVMDEWAVVASGTVAGSSSKGFAQAVSEQVASPGLALLVQEPMHVLNGRHIPKPKLRLLSKELPPFRRGAGEVVAARLEFSRDNLVDSLTFLYSSESVDERWLRRLLPSRLELEFATEKRHRTAAYVVLRLGSELEVVDTATVLPQCCCGVNPPEPCIPDL